MMNTPKNPKIKEKFPNLIKGISEISKSILFPTGSQTRHVLLFTVLMEGLGSNQERK